MLASDRETRIIGAAAAAIFAVYAYTLSPSIAGGDSGEIVAEGCQLGIAHPPGYPLITVIIHFISRLPLLGSVAYRVNTFCALCTAVASFLIGSTVFRLSPASPLPSLAGAILAMTTFSFSPLIWQYALTAEVFPLNTLFAALILYLTVRFSMSGSGCRTMALIGSLTCGLALCNQHTIILYEAPLVLWLMVLMRRALFTDRAFLSRMTAAFFIGLLPYAYLPLSALFNPRPGSWGDLASVGGFLHHFLRKDYGTFRLFSGAAGKDTEGLWQRNEAYVNDLMNTQSLQVCAALAVVGLVCSILMPRSNTSNITSAGELDQAAKPSKASKKLRKPEVAVVVNQAASGSCGQGLQVSAAEAAWTPLVLLLTQLFYLFVFHSLSNLPLKDKLLYGVHQRFWMQPNVLTFIWVGVGFNALLHLLWTAFCKMSTANTESSNTRKLFIAMALVISVCLSGLQLRNAFPQANQRDSYHFNQYASAVLSPLPPNAVLLINYDQQWTSVRYMQLCEGYRTDVTAIQLSMMTYRWFQTKLQLYPHLTFPGRFLSYERSPLISSDRAFTVLQFLKANDDKEVFLGGKLSYADSELGKTYDLQPVGLVSKFTLLEAEPNGTVYTALARHSWEKVVSALPALPDLSKYPEETWEWTIGRDYKDRLSETAAFVLLTAIKSAASDVRPLVDAAYWLESAIWKEGGPQAAHTSLLKNAGLAHVHLIQSKLVGDEQPLPTPMDVHGTLQQLAWPEGKGWHGWCSERFMDHWKLFLLRPDAVHDQQYSTVKQMYAKVNEAMSRSRTKPKQRD